MSTSPAARQTHPANAISRRPGIRVDRDLLPSQVRARFARATGPSPELSLVAPAYEEEENLEKLYDRVREVLDDRISWELVLVDDGSGDRSPEVIRELAAADPRVVGVFFARNCGQTAATAAGIQLARGAVIATIDADLQNDPADVPAMLALLDGHDAVVGYRVKRHDDFVRRASSRIANEIRNRLSGDRIRDTGCSLKVFRAEAIQSIPLFEGMHRFLPTLLRYHGFSVIEHPVGHRPRVAGKSKYGVANRAWRAFKDLIAVRWMRGRRLLLPIREVTDAP
ncbi:MAG: glycosyltransferase family 2 protein [Planctomycetota bacterium]